MMTEIEGRTYYYKEVEESASRLADLLEELIPTLIAQLSMT